MKILLSWLQDYVQTGDDLDALAQARAEGLASVAAATTLDELRSVESEVLGKRGPLARA